MQTRAFIFCHAVWLLRLRQLARLCQRPPLFDGHEFFYFLFIILFSLYQPPLYFRHRLFRHLKLISHQVWLYSFFQDTRSPSQLQSFHVHFFLLHFD